MKTKLKLILTAAIIAIGQILTLPASAAEAKVGDHGYLGIAGGLLLLDIACPSSFRCEGDTRIFGGRVYGGYMVNEHFGAEVGYYHASGTVIEIQNGSTTTEIGGTFSAPYFAAIFRAPVSDNAALIGRAGVLKYDFEVESNVSGRSINASTDGTEVLLGAGVEWSAGNLALRGEYTRYEKDASGVEISAIHRF